MSAAAALILALAVLVPRSPRSRLGVFPARRVTAAGALGAAAACGAAAAAVVLPLPAVLAGTLVAGTAALRYRRHRRNRRGLAECRTLAAALGVLVGELRVGAHPVRALSVAATEAGRTGVSAGLRGLAARARLGGDVCAGLRSIAGPAVLAAQWDRLAVCWQLAVEHGLPMATLMQAAHCDLGERQRFSARVRAAMAGARATAAILAGLPVFGVLLGQLIGAQPVGFLLGVGGWLLVAGVTLACGGLLWSDRITERAVSW